MQRHRSCSSPSSNRRFIELTELSSHYFCSNPKKLFHHKHHQAGKVSPSCGKKQKKFVGRKTQCMEWKTKSTSKLNIILIKLLLLMLMTPSGYSHHHHRHLLLFG